MARALVAALVAGSAVAYAVSGIAPVDAAAPDTAAIEAYDFGWRDPATGQPTTTIAQGGTVTFGYPSGTSSHNVDFTGSQPTTCTQTAGTDTGSVPPLPAVPTAAGWAGSCRFDAPGTYGFVCGLHAYMSGTVAVVDPTATTPTGTTTTPTGTTTTPTGTTPAPFRPTVRVARSQRGTVVRGSVATAATGSRIVATALVAKRALAARRLVRVGSQSKRSKGIGRTAFAVRLNAGARAALVRRRRLAVKLRVVVTPLAGQAVTKTVAVTLRYR